MKSRPPTPLPALLLWRRMTRFSAVICLVGIAVGLAAWASSGNGRALIIAVPGVLLLAASLTHRIPILQQSLLSGLSASVGWLFGRPLIGLLVGGGYLGLVWIRGRRMPKDFTADSIVELPGFAVGVGAEAFAQQFLELGYQPAGAYTFPAMGHAIIASLLVGPDADRYATVTDAILTVTSRFGDRTLVTRNSAHSRLAPHVLDNPDYGAEPARLDQRHTDALALVAGRGAPDSVSVDSVTALAVRNEQRNIAWVSTQADYRLPGSGRGTGPLTENLDRPTLITSWLAGDGSIDSTSPEP